MMPMPQKRLARSDANIFSETSLKPIFNFNYIPEAFIFLRYNFLMLEKWQSFCLTPVEDKKHDERGLPQKASLPARPVHRRVPTVEIHDGVNVNVSLTAVK